jgi:hypothetical protein
MSHSSTLELWGKSSQRQNALFVAVPLPLQGVENHNCIALQSAETLEKQEISEKRILNTARSIESYQLFSRINPVGNVPRNSPLLEIIMFSVQIIVLNCPKQKNARLQQLAESVVQDLHKM